MAKKRAPAKRSSAKQLLHSHPTQVGEYQQNLANLEKIGQLHRIQAQHHRNAAKLHLEQSAALARLKPTHPGAEQYLRQTERLAKQHLVAAGLHDARLFRTRETAQRQIERMRALQNPQKMLRPKLAKPRQRRR